MLNDAQAMVEAWFHSIQIDNTGEEGEQTMVPLFPNIDTKRVLNIGFQNAHGVHLINAHDKWVEAMEKSQDLQRGAFGLI